MASSINTPRHGSSPAPALALAAALAVAASLVAGTGVARADELGACASVNAKADGTVTPLTSCAATLGQALLEFGYGNRSFTGAQAFGATAYPNAAIRYGVVRSLEFDAYAPSYQRVRIPGGVLAQGWGDAGVGLRYQLQQGGASATAALASATLPTGEANLTAGKAQYALGLANRYAFTPRLALQSSIAYASQYQNGFVPVQFSSYQPAVALVASATKSTSLYLGANGTTKAGPGLGPEYRLGAAVRHQLATGTAVELGVDDGLTSVNGTRSHAIDFAVTQAVR
jgi:hypothetical protein